jgi:hypothetical protein
VTHESFDNITAETILKTNEICDAHNKIIYVINQGLDINTADILSSLATFDDSVINCLCMDLKDNKETSDFINELCLANVNAVKFTRDENAGAAVISAEFERFLNGFVI